MKKLPILSKISFLILPLFIMIFFSACATKMEFNKSSIAPAAVGYVKIKNDNNKNYTVELNITNLAPSSQLSPSKSTYVVWMNTKNNGNKNIGQLNSSSGIFSKTLKASLTTVTSFEPTGFFITAEDNGNIQYPGTQIVLSTN